MKTFTVTPRADDAIGSPTSWTREAARDPVRVLSVFCPCFVREGRVTRRHATEARDLAGSTFQSLADGPFLWRDGLDLRFWTKEVRRRSSSSTLPLRSQRRPSRSSAGRHRSQ